MKNFTIAFLYILLGITIVHANVDSDLLDAAAEGSTHEVKTMLKKGAYIQATNSKGQTPLHLASENGDLDLVKVLVWEGALINVKDKDGKSPLDIAKVKENDKVIRYFNNVLKARENLLDAAKNGKLSTVKMYVERKVSIFLTDEEGNTPLHLAAMNGHSVTSDFLINEGADPEQTNKAGKSAYDLAEENKQDKATKLLKNAIRRNKLLLKYSKEGNFRKVQSLINDNANKNYKGKTGKTPLHYAAESGHHKIVEFLIYKKALLNAVDEDGKTPLDYAMQNGSSKTIRFIRVKGGISSNPENN